MSSILYVGVDLHEKESQFAVFEQDGSLVEERRIPTGELATFLSSLPGEERVAMESVGFVYPVYDYLSSLQGCSVTVANVNKLQLISRSSTKHDVADARILGDLLRTNYLPVAHMRDPETREKLAVVQERVNYGLKRGELKGSIRWLLKRRGIEVEKPFGPEGRARLRTLRLQEVDNRLAELGLAESILERLDARSKISVHVGNRLRALTRISVSPGFRDFDVWTFRMAVLCAGPFATVREGEFRPLNPRHVPKKEVLLSPNEFGHQPDFGSPNGDWTEPWRENASLSADQPGRAPRRDGLIANNGEPRTVSVMV